MRHLCTYFALLLLGNDLGKMKMLTSKFILGSMMGNVNLCEVNEKLLFYSPPNLINGSEKCGSNLLCNGRICGEDNGTIFVANE